MFGSCTRGAERRGRRAAGSFAWAAILLLAAAAPVRAEETKEQALEALSRHAVEVNSWTADYLMLMSAQGTAVTTEGRMEVQGTQLRNEMTVDMMGQSVPVVAVTGADGVTWTETELFGQKSVMKLDAAQLAGGMNPAAGQQAIDPRKLVEMLRETPEAAYLGRDEVEGEAVFAFEMPLDEETRQAFDATGQMAQLGIQPDKLQLMVAERDGFPRLWQLLDAAGATVTSVLYRNVKLNVEIPASRFQYAPPEGGAVMDLTALAGELLGNLENSESLSSNPEVQELLGQLGKTPEEEEPKEEKVRYNQKFQAGDAAPDFTAKTIGGETIALSAFKGQVVLLDFWASWSEPYEQRSLAQVVTAAQTHGDAIRIIGVNLDEDRAAAEAFLKKHPEMTWPQVFDGKGWSSAVGELYGIEAIPHRILIGGDGVILKTGMRGPGLMEAVNRALAR